MSPYTSVQVIDEDTRHNLISSDLLESLLFSKMMCQKSVKDALELSHDMEFWSTGRKDILAKEENTDHYPKG